MAEKEECVCENGGSLDILDEVHRAYDARMKQIERAGGSDKLQKQVAVLRSWVSDLVEQNTLLVRAVTELEKEALDRVAAERRRHKEVECELRAESLVLRRRLTRKDADVRGLIEVLRRLRDQDNTPGGIHFFEVTKSEIFGEDEWFAQKLGKDRGDFKNQEEPGPHFSRRRSKHL